jgi:hypothetical protein
MYRVIFLKKWLFVADAAKKAKFELADKEVEP